MAGDGGGRYGLVRIGTHRYVMVGGETCSSRSRTSELQLVMTGLWAPYLRWYPWLVLTVQPRPTPTLKQLSKPL